MEAPVAPHAPAGLPVPSRRVLVLAAAIGVLGILFWLGRDILAPFVVGLLIVYLLDPVVERLARITIADRRPPRWLVILLVYLVATIAVVELVLLLINPLIEQVRLLVENGPAYVEMLQQRLNDLLAWWNRLQLPEDVKQAIDEAIRDLFANIGSLATTIVRPIFSSVIGLVGSVFGYLIIPVWTFWILKDRPAIVRRFDRAVPPEWRADIWAMLGIVRRVFGSWIRGQLILGLVVGAMTFVGLMILGAFVNPVFSRYAVLLSVIAGVLELLPVIGPIIAAIPAVLLGATAGLPGIVAALILYTAVQQLENNLLVPKIQGDATNLHPAVVIFSLILAGAIAGLLGAILALPIAATMRDIYVYAFRRAGGMDPEAAATGDARPAPDTGLAGIDGQPGEDGSPPWAGPAEPGEPAGGASNPTSAVPEPAPAGQAAS